MSGRAQQTPATVRSASVEERRGAPPPGPSARAQAHKVRGALADPGFQDDRATDRYRGGLVAPAVAQSSAVQFALSGREPTLSPGEVRTVAIGGLGGGGASLPHAATIQSAFGHHDVRGVRAHLNASASAACATLSAEAYTRGEHIAFAGAPSLRISAHEASHVVQQRHGAVPRGGVGAPGDRFERHADAVADRVARGQSAEALMDRMAQPKGITGTPVVQLYPKPPFRRATVVGESPDGDRWIVAFKDSGIPAEGKGPALRLLSYRKDWSDQQAIGYHQAPSVAILKAYDPQAMVKVDPRPPGGMKLGDGPHESFKPAVRVEGRVGWVQHGPSAFRLNPGELDDAVIADRAKRDEWRDFLNYMLTVYTPSDPGAMDRRAAILRDLQRIDDPHRQVNYKRLAFAYPDKEVRLVRGRQAEPERYEPHQIEEVLVLRAEAVRKFKKGLYGREGYRGARYSDLDRALNQMDAWNAKAHASEMLIPQRALRRYDVAEAPEPHTAYDMTPTQTHRFFLSPLWKELQTARLSLETKARDREQQNALDTQYRQAQGYSGFGIADYRRFRRGQGDYAAAYKALEGWQGDGTRQWLTFHDDEWGRVTHVEVPAVDSEYKHTRRHAWLGADGKTVEWQRDDKGAVVEDVLFTPPPATADLHLALDIVGMLPIPIVSELADGVNAVIYVFEGDLANAALSAAALVPLAGSAVTAVKLGRSAKMVAKATEILGETGGRLAPHMGKAVLKMSPEGAANVARVVDEVGKDGTSFILGRLKRDLNRAGKKGLTETVLREKAAAYKRVALAKRSKKLAKSMKAELVAAGHAKGALNKLDDGDLRELFDQAQATRHAQHMLELEKASPELFELARKGTTLEEGTDLVGRVERKLGAAVSFTSKAADAGSVGIDVVRNYGTGFRAVKGSILEVSLQVGPGAKLADILAHAPALTSLKRYEGVIGQARQWVDGIGRILGRSARRAPEAGMFEAWQEVRKLPGIIDDRVGSLRHLDEGSVAHTQVRRELAFLELQLEAHHQRLISGLGGESGTVWAKLPAEDAANLKLTPMADQDQRILDAVDWTETKRRADAHQRRRRAVDRITEKPPIPVPEELLPARVPGAAMEAAPETVRIPTTPQEPALVGAQASVARHDVVTMPIRSVTREQGHALLERISRGDPMALHSLGAGRFADGFDPRAVEWAIVDWHGTQLLVRGQITKVDYVGLGYEKMIAHSHPYRTSERLGPAAENITMSALMYGNSPALRAEAVKVIPSAEDLLHVAAQGGAAKHTVFTPYRVSPEGFIVNPDAPGASELPSLRIEISAAVDTGRRMGGRPIGSARIRALSSNGRPALFDRRFEAVRLSSGHTRFSVEGALPLPSSPPLPRAGAAPAAPTRSGADRARTLSDLLGPDGRFTDPTLRRHYEAAVAGRQPRGGRRPPEQRGRLEWATSQRNGAAADRLRELLPRDTALADALRVEHGGVASLDRAAREAGLPARPANHQAHHIVPIEVLATEAFYLEMRARHLLNANDPMNLVWLPTTPADRVSYVHPAFGRLDGLPSHRGSHPKTSAEVRSVVHSFQHQHLADAGVTRLDELSDDQVLELHFEIQHEVLNNDIRSLPEIYDRPGDDLLNRVK